MEGKPHFPRSQFPPQVEQQGNQPNFPRPPFPPQVEQQGNQPNFPRPPFPLQVEQQGNQPNFPRPPFPSQVEQQGNQPNFPRPPFPPQVERQGNQPNFPRPPFPPQVERQGNQPNFPNSPFPPQDERRNRKRPFVIIASILVIAMMLSLLIFVINAWHTALPTTTHQPKPVTHTTTPIAQPTATSQPTATPTPPSQQLISQIDGLFTKLVAQHSFSGSVLVEQDGQAVLQKGYSMADWTKQMPNDPDTRFFLGSLTKEFTATAILLLQERGKLHVQDSVCVYVQPCPPPWQPVTIQEILSHTSGIPEDSNIGGNTPSAWIASFDDDPLSFTPGSQFNYCSTCYQILAYVVEQASGEAYAQFQQENIFDPLHMQSTSFNSKSFYTQPDHATGYASWQVLSDTLGWDDIGITSSWSFLFGSGVLTTTVGDLYLWDQGLDAHKILSQASLDQAYTATSPTSDFANTGYGDGWFIGKSPVPGHRLIWHYGSIDGFRTYIGRYIDDDVTIIFLSNLANTDSVSIAHSVEQLIF